ncbi:MAG: YkvA family protein [Pseudomonadales bacterium]|jgi:uncharacterized membrane protein YkvA (DUF1232 family)|nr:YkvA family protein [Pseudomonadales bacterium]
MTLRVTFDLQEEDLKFFRTQMNKAKKAAKSTSEAEIVAAAEEALETVKGSKVPKFVTERLKKIEALTKMLGDEEWQLEGDERKNVVSALSYFADPEDMIADDIPVIGFIDDAIMIELVVRELSNEIDAYTDFLAYKKSAPKGRESRAEWLASKRKQLYSRMRRRRSRSLAGGRTRVRLF